MKERFTTHWNDIGLKVRGLLPILLVKKYSTFGLKDISDKTMLTLREIYDWSVNNNCVCGYFNILL